MPKMLAPVVPPPAFPAPVMFLHGGATYGPPTVAPSHRVDGRVGLACSPSMSSGSMTPLSCDEDATPPSLTSSLARAYPAPVGIKNTFINMAIGRPPSLEAFYEERQVSSCPATRCPSFEEYMSGDGVNSTCEGASADLQIFETGASADTEVPPDGADAFDPGCCPSAFAAEEEAVSLQARAVVGCSGHPKQVLRLDDFLVQPVLGSPELPTAGSAGHRFGGCKPCAFAHTKGCENGVNCQFCHLCEPGEKKRRQKQKVVRRPESRSEEKLDLRQDVRAEVGLVVSRPMLSPVTSPVMSRPVMSPTVGHRQGSLASNMRMAAVFWLF